MSIETLSSSLINDAAAGSSLAMALQLLAMAMARARSRALSLIMSSESEIIRWSRMSGRTSLIIMI